MAQETSGVPLNYYLALRHRLPDHPTVLFAQALFAFAFLVWRLLLGTYGTYHYVAYAAGVLPSTFTSLHARALGGTLVLASALQWYWGYVIVKACVKAAVARKVPKTSSRKGSCGS